MCVVRNAQASRTTHIGLESPMGPCLRHVMFAHIMRVEVVRCDRMSTTCRRKPAESSSPACHAGEQCLRWAGLHRRRLRQLGGWNELRLRVMERALRNVNVSGPRPVHT